MQINRRSFLTSATLSLAGTIFPLKAFSVGPASQIELSQLIYGGGNWRPRPTALRRLAWEIHKRCSIDAALEPSEVKAQTKALSKSPILYMSGDRSFYTWLEPQILALRRFLKLGGTLIVDPADTIDGDYEGFETSMDELMSQILPKIEPKSVNSSHVLFRTFYQIERPVGRILGPPNFTGYTLGDRLAVIRTHHDLGGAWARDNLGNWEYHVDPGGDKQRETAFRIGINLVLYALCLDYKDEEPHRRFGKEAE